MPFKDIDYKELNRAREIEIKLKKMIAMDNKFINPNLTPEEKIGQAELISGRTLQPKLNPVRELLREKEIIRSVAPVVKALAKLPINDIAPPHAAIAPPPQAAIAPPQAAIAPPLAGIDLYERHSISAEAMEYYRTAPALFPNLNTLAMRNNQERIRALLDELTSKSKSLGRYKGIVLQNISRADAQSGDIPEEWIQQETQYNAELKYISNYKKALKKLKIGRGVVHPSTNGSGIFTSIQEIMERVQVLLGEIEAGNTSINLRNELAELLHYMYEHKRIRKQDYTNLIKAINKS